MQLTADNSRSLRDGFGEAILKLGEKNPDIVVLTADLSESTRTHHFENKFPDRFFQIGVAEQNMTGIAAGLALSGKIPFMTSISVFSPGNNWSQIRTGICLSKANVKIIGSHAGYSSPADGSTHQALEDIALTRVLPNMTVIVPADHLQTIKAVEAVAAFEGPVYIRLAREATPVLTNEDDDFSIGKADVMNIGDDVSMIFCGPVGYEVLIAAQELKEEHGIGCDVINCSTVKPLDKETILHSAKKTKHILTVEEHQVAGGLGSAIAELISEEFPVPVKRMGAEDSFGESGTYPELLEKNHLTKEHIIGNVLKLLEKKE